ncbi:MAG: RNA-binding S4 domain-containing protein [Bacteroidales bacterium]|jgi:ribosome-associated protein|nr:RNA-binding S4 domain-containing protein [Bacteroidales bacterium]
MEFKLKPNEEYITLIQLLKAVNIASSGSQAQMMVVNGEVKLNDIVEYRKRAKIRHGDTVSVFDKTIKIE